MMKFFGTQIMELIKMSDYRMKNTLIFICFFTFIFNQNFDSSDTILFTGEQSSSGDAIIFTEDQSAVNTVVITDKESVPLKDSANTSKEVPINKEESASKGWIAKYLGYSSIQAKLIKTIVAILAFIIIRRIFLKIINRRTSDALIRYRTQKTSTYIIGVLAFIIIGRIWFDGIQSIATYLGLLSAGLAIALKEPITNIFGWVFILWRVPFTVGDRVQLGENSGDVIDINFFNFTLMEIGHWAEGNSATGRIVHVPNGKVFIDTLANYGRGFKYIWNEIPVLVTFESDWNKAKEILIDIAKKHADHVTKAAAKKFKETSKLFMMYKPNFNPVVYTKVKDSGVELTIRYVCNPRKRRASTQAIWEDVLNEYSKEESISFAYPTVRYFDHLSEELKETENNKS